MTPAGPLLTVIQYHGGDAADAFDLARLLALTNAPDFALMFYRAPDAPLPPVDLARELAEHNLAWSVHTSTVTAKGWPAGPNATWRELVGFILDNPDVHPACNHVFTAEPDSSPMSTFWAQDLLREHLKGVAGGKIFSGCIRTAANGSNLHMNGNLIFDRAALKSFADLGKLLGSTAEPWDVAYAPVILPAGHDNLMLWSDWRGEQRPASWYFSRDRGAGPCVWLHGFKGGCLRNAVRRAWFGRDAAEPPVFRTVVHSPKPVALAGRGWTQQERVFTDALRLWAASGGWFVKCRDNFDFDLPERVCRHVKELGNPPFFAARHPDNQPDELCFSQLADTTVVYAEPGHPFLAEAAKCKDEAAFAEALGARDDITWLNQGLWEPVEPPQQHVPRYAVLFHNKGVWHVPEQTDEFSEAAKAGSRLRMSGPVFLADTKDHTLRQMQPISNSLPTIP